MHFHSFPQLKLIFFALIILATSVAFGVGDKSIFVHAQSQPCPISSSNTIVADAIAICNGQGQAINNWSGNLAVPYIYGGGHNPTSPGPDTGKKSICPAGQSSSCGVDCSGFARWVYYLAYNDVDVLGAGNTQSQMSLLTQVATSSTQPGDLVYFVNKATTPPTYHVGVYIGTNQMIDSPNANGHPPHFVRLDKVLNKKGQGTFGTLIGYFRYTTSSHSGKLDWKYQTGGIVSSAPAVVNGVAYAGSEDYNLYALNANTGKVIWKYPTGFYVSSTPAVVGGIVYFGSDDTYVYALNASNGKLDWKYQTGYFVESTPAVVGGVVYVSSDDGYIYALKASTGGLVWKTYTDSAYSSPTVVNGVLYVGSKYGYVDALNTGNGKIAWQYQTGNEILASPVVVNGVIYIGSNDYNFYAISASAGTLIWSYPTGGYSFSATAAVSNGVVYVGDDGGHFDALKASSGTLIWSHSTNVDILSAPSVAHGTVYIGLDNVYAFNASTGAVDWKYGKAQGFSSLTAVNGLVYAGSYDHFVYALYG